MSEVEVALAGPLGGSAQTVAEFKLGLEVVGLQPVEGVLAELAGQQRLGGGARYWFSGVVAERIGALFEA